MVRRVAQLIKDFGGLTSFARDIGVPITTAQHWKKANNIPVWRQASVKVAIKKAGMDPQAYEEEAA